MRYWFNRRLVGPLVSLGVFGLGGWALVMAAGAGSPTGSTVQVLIPGTAPQFDQQIARHAADMINQGRQTFRFDTFGDEAFFGQTLELQRAIAGAANGGVGPGVSPATALAVGLKVDADACRFGRPGRPERKREPDRSGHDAGPAEAECRRGHQGVVRARGRISTMGISCALCHSTVDNSFSAGIGRRLDGWANRDLNVGAILALAPNLKPVAALLGQIAGVKEACSPGARASSTRNCSWTGRRFVPTTGLPPSSSPTRSGWQA